MPFYDKIMSCKHSIVELINDRLENIFNVEHSRHRSFHNSAMNLIAALGAYFFRQKSFPLSSIISVQSNCHFKLILGKYGAKINLHAK
ncbi:MAG: transposase [Cytophagaceae bacterium]|jgi:hypothetical protein|nr:transposase [Cytophagaceae bacterium]